MANPQKENGFVPIANEIAEALMRIQINGYQNRLLWAIWRKTYGFQKVEDWIANSQLVEMTGLHKSHVSRAIKQLTERRMVTKNGNKVAFNKDYSQWLVLLPKMATVTKNGNTVTKNGNSQLPELADTKETITKETITKESGRQQPLKKRKEINGEVDRGHDITFDSFLDYCKSKNIIPALEMKKYFLLKNEYELKTLWWNEVKGCINWLFDNGFKKINAQRLRKRMDNAIKFAKEREIRRLQENQDKKFAPTQKIIKNIPIWTPPL